MQESEILNEGFLEYPVVLVHGFGFRDGKRLCYWGRIPNLLKAKGGKVFYGEQDSCGTIEDNACFLKDRIVQVLKETGAEKVNIIAHSKGGLEARYLISSMKEADKIASLTTIGTPHRGSKSIEKIPKFILKVTGFFMNIWMRILGDRRPDAYRAYLSFRADSAE
ncbi:MAG: triacylglycerol lipase, partial [Clostridia bacterium]|nr:triacylglycerol lipase [Clostridia bacterium]